MDHCGTKKWGNGKGIEGGGVKSSHMNEELRSRVLQKAEGSKEGYLVLSDATEFGTQDWQRLLHFMAGVLLTFLKIALLR